MRTAQAFAFTETGEPSMHVSRDYFWMLHSGMLEQNTRQVWRLFRSGHDAMSAYYDEHDSSIAHSRGVAVSEA